MRVAHLVLTQPAATELIDEMTSGQPVVDDATTGTPQRNGGELPLALRRHAHEGYRPPVCTPVNLIRLPM